MTDLFRMSDTQFIAAVAGCITFIVGAVVSNVAARREANRVRPENER
jgi:hypothetical protein